MSEAISVKQGSIFANSLAQFTLSFFVALSLWTFGILVFIPISVGVQETSGIANIISLIFLVPISLLVFNQFVNGKRALDIYVARKQKDRAFERFEPNELKLLGYVGLVVVSAIFLAPFAWNVAAAFGGMVITIAVLAVSFFCLPLMKHIASQVKRRVNTKS